MERSAESAPGGAGEQVCRVQESGYMTAMDEYALEWQKEADAWSVQIQVDRHRAQLEAIKSATRARDVRTALEEAMLAQITAGATQYASVTADHVVTTGGARNAPETITRKQEQEAGAAPGALVTASLNVKTAAVPNAPAAVTQGQEQEAGAAQRPVTAVLNAATGAVQEAPVTVSQGSRKESSKQRARRKKRERKEEASPNLGCEAVAQNVDAQVLQNEAELSVQTHEREIAREAAAAAGAEDTVGVQVDAEQVEEAVQAGNPSDMGVETAAQVEAQVRQEAGAVPEASAAVFLQVLTGAVPEASVTVTQEQGEIAAGAAQCGPVTAAQEQGEMAAGAAQCVPVTAAQEQVGAAHVEAAETEKAATAAQEQVDAAQVEASDEEETESWSTEDSEWEAECDDWFQKVQEELTEELRQVQKEDRLQWLAAWHFGYRKQAGWLQVWRDWSNGSAGYGFGMTSETEEAEGEAADWATNMVQEICETLVSWQEQEDFYAGEGAAELEEFQAQVQAAAQEAEAAVQEQETAQEQAAAHEVEAAAQEAEAAAQEDRQRNRWKKQQCRKQHNNSKAEAQEQRDMAAEAQAQEQLVAAQEQLEAIQERRQQQRSSKTTAEAAATAQEVAQEQLGAAEEAAAQVDQNKIFDQGK